MTLLSPRATAFHGRDTLDGFNPPGEEWRPPAQPPRAVLDALWRAMAAHDLETAQHALRVMHLGVAVAQEPELEDAAMIASIRGAAPLHDIGKLAVPDCLLNRPGPLSPGEYEVVKRHATIGGDILEGIPGGRPLAAIVRHHHESWDGSGYPDGLRGEAIPPGARIVAVVDCYDALTSRRPYRRPLDHAEAMAMIVAGRGTAYDPAVIDVFVRVIQRLGHPYQFQPLRVL